MWSVASGNSRSDVPQSVGKEFAEADPGGKLPEKAKDLAPSKWAMLKKLFGEWISEEEKEAEHRGGEDAGTRHDPAADPGGHLQNKAKDMTGSNWTDLFGLLRKFFTEEAHEPEHREGTDQASSHGAGVAFVTPDGKMLFLRRSGKGDHEGEWSLPGGTGEGVETPEECATREAKEELGDCMLDKLHAIDRATSKDGVDYVTFAQPVEAPFRPKLNEEHDGFDWRFVDQPPSPLHPGVVDTLKRVLHVGEDAWSEEARKAALEARQAHAKAAETHGFNVGAHGASYTNYNHPSGRIVTHYHPSITESFWRHISPKKEKLGEGETAQELHQHLAAYGKDAAADPSGKLSATTREQVGSTEHREDMPDSMFLLPAQKKYPIGAKNDEGEWKPTRNLLLAASKEARMHGRTDLARRADAMRAREFPEAATDGRKALDWALPRTKIQVKLAQDRQTRGMAFDKALSKYTDDDGRLHVTDATISRAVVNEYTGDEINRVMEGEPGWKPLDPEKRYAMLRDPKEMKKAVDTFNGLPLLWTHAATSAKDHPGPLTIGATGTNARFDDEGNLKNDLTIWPEHAIKAVDDGERKELSAGYSYKADMTPGTYEGKPYAGVMRDIKGNHLAIVPKGRVGREAAIDHALLDITARRRSWASPRA